MVFSGGLFLLYFLPIVMTGYFFIPKKLKNTYLLLASLFFYWWGAPSFLWMVLFTSGLNFFIAKQIFITNKRKIWLIIYVSINLTVLFYFKYFNFFIENLNQLLNQLNIEPASWREVILPVGVSFFTFQSITYGVDVYRKEAEPQKNILDYWLYVLFFPQLIAGPIVRYQTIADQLKLRESSVNTFLDGFLRFTIGLGKKILIANILAAYGKLLLETENLYTLHSTPIAWLITISYTFEIYFDFSGYSDMAIGLGKMVGFTFPENFNRPYLSKSITEFWRRWHITLGDFMKNYLYIPLGGNKTNKNKTYANLATVFVLSGLWHGAAWNFLLWGVFHGFWLILERILPKNINLPSSISMLITFFIVANGWVLFDASSLSEVMQHFSAMYSFQNFDYVTDKNIRYYEIHLAIAAIICLLGFSPKLNNLYTISLSSIKNSYFKLTVYFGAIVVFLISLSHVITGSFNPFIYFKF